MTIGPAPAKPQVWLDGERVAADWPLLRALHYGDGVFRTMLVHGGRVHDLPGQLSRFQRDAARLELDLAPVEQMSGEIHAAVAGIDQGVLKLVASRVARERGYAPGTRECRMLSFLDPLPTWPHACWEGGVVVRDSPIRLGHQVELAGVKHLNRLEQVLASRGWMADQHEALMCDHDEHVICGTRSNLFAWVGERLVTPALDRAGVAGLTRDRVMELAERLGSPVQVATLPRAELAQARECFLTGSLFGIWPIRELAGKRFEAPGPLTAQLMQALAHPWSGT